MDEAAISIAFGKSVSVNPLYVSLAELCAFANAPRYANAHLGKSWAAPCATSVDFNCIGVQANVFP